MASYIDSALNKNESIIERAQISWLSELFSIVLGFILLFLYGLGLIVLLFVFIKIWTTELALTNQRIIAKMGLIRRDTVELKLDKVESLGVHQSILGRILGYGTIIVTGTGGTITPIPCIKDPMGFRRIFNNYLEEKMD